MRRRLSCSPRPATRLAGTGLAALLVLAPAWAATLEARGGARRVEAVDGRPLPAALAAVEHRCRDGVVASSAPEASAAGASILRAGGNAVDAAVATAFALGVVEPAACGLGGQTYLLVHLADGRDVAVDGSATVPFRASARELAELRESGIRSDHRLAAVPASLAALDHALRRFGTMSLAEVLAPAIALAEGGHRLTATHESVISGHVELLRQSPELSRVYLGGDLEPLEAGHLYCPDRLAATLRRLAAGGAAAFYRGEIATEIAADMRANGGWIERADLAHVRAVERSPLRGAYRGREVVSFPAPGGGGAVIQALHILDALPTARLARSGLDRLVVLAEASRLALVDGYWGDEPLAARAALQLDPAHAALRAAQIRTDRPLSPAEIGAGGDSPWRQAGTTHISVIDGAGNAVSLTQTLGGEFGAAVATPSLGFAYNSFLGLFATEREGSSAYPYPGRAAATTMAPTMLLHEGRPWLVLGGAGSGRITSTIVDTISNLVDRRLGLGEAVAAPRILWDYAEEPRYLLELAGPPGEAEADRLEARGWQPLYRLFFPPRPVDLLAFGGVNAALRDPHTGELVAVADPRRNGSAATACAP